MSAPPFFQSAGRGDLLFWEGKEGPTIVLRESLSEQEKESWLEELSTLHDWVVWCKSKKGAEEICSFELIGKEIFFNYDETKSKEEKRKEQEQKEGTSWAEHTIQVVVEARQHQNGSERASRFMLGSQRSHCHNKTNSGFVDCSQGAGRKG